MGYIYEIQDGELKHYGVLGMKWGVRKAARNSRIAARKRYKKTISTATNEKAIRDARDKYQRERTKINQKAKRELDAIEAGRPAIVHAGKKAGKAALKGLGAVTITAASIAGSAALGLGAIMKVLDVITSDD